MKAGTSPASNLNGGSLTLPFRAILPDRPVIAYLQTPKMLPPEGDSINTTFFCIPPITALSEAPELAEHQYSPYHFYYCPSFDPGSIYDGRPDLKVDNAQIIPSSGAVACYIRNDSDCDSDSDGDSGTFTYVDKPVVRRSLTHPHILSIEDAMRLSMIEDAQVTMPGSPPELTGSKSSKSSSFHSSYQSDEGSILADANHFEDIGLDDDGRSERETGEFDLKSPNPYTTTYANDLRAVKRPPVRMAKMHTAISQRELTSSKSRPTYPSLKGHVLSVTGDPQGLGLLSSTPTSRRGYTNNSTPTLATMGKRYRSPSPLNSINGHSQSNSRYSSGVSPNPGRGSWHSNRDRKTQKELEQECDEEDGDDVPDECFLENVPISPRPLQERATSLPPSPDPVEKKQKVKNVGNGTPPVPIAQGSLKSPVSPAKLGSGNRGMSMGQFPIHHEGYSLKTRAKSWGAALSELSEEAKALTEALEIHADEQKSNPKQKRSQSSTRPQSLERSSIKSMAELPPLRRTNIMIDPLPISKEKEAVLSRTRPSWLPPKNPNEERRHLREYQRMMASSLEADRRKQVDSQARISCKDDTASSLLRIWEEHVLPNWDAATSQKRTRELWWRGIAPRSRGAVWQRAVGNELELTNASYHAALSRAKALERKLAQGDGSWEEKKMGGWFAAIRRDVPMTYPELRIFQAGGPLCEPLVDVLMAYAMYRSDVGYVSGTNTVTALLLLNLPTPQSTFITLSNILNRPLPLSFHTHDQGATTRVRALTLSTLASKLPRLYSHLCNQDAHFHNNPEQYLDPVFSSLFTRSVDLDSVTRLWDVWVFEGDAVLVRAAVAIFTCLEGKLYGANCKEDLLRIVRNGVESGEEEKWIRAVREAGRNQSSVGDRH